MVARLILVVGLGACLFALAQAHMAIYDPCIMDTRNDKCKGFGKVDYDIASPTGQAHQYDDKNGVENLNGGVCRTMPNEKTAVTWAAGSTNTITFANHGSHKGGFCEWAVSYNEGVTFVVFNTDLNYLKDAKDIEKYSEKLTLPAGLPNGNATISWTWVNREGFREFYWSCFRAQITGSTATSFVGKPLAIFNFAFVHNGKAMAYVLPEFRNKKEYTELYTNRPDIEVSATTVTGGEGSIFPLKLEGAKGLKVKYEDCLYIPDKMPVALTNNGVESVAKIAAAATVAALPAIIPLPVVLPPAKEGTKDLSRDDDQKDQPKGDDKNENRDKDNKKNRKKSKDKKRKRKNKKHRKNKTRTKVRNRSRPM